ncbi:suppressor of cytokine signaling 3b [Alosa sapidissima]|uniref:suppressor of cytokine signaling 3b n=1 Tax=Alosa sapidissima TaxID=34773 RepID=UPI001C0951DB|nr:suppressor of cytokine signaling 3b [Alosa sapidissima]
MVTHSRFDSFPVMSSSPVECGRRLPHRHRYKTFSSRLQYQLVLSAARKLQESGFYWSSMGGKEASSLLNAEPAGTFLVRDSSDHRHFFTLSVKTVTGTKNLRIQCDACSFYLQTDPCDAQKVPHFDCVLKLIHHYMPTTTTTTTSALGSLSADSSSAGGGGCSSGGASGSSAAVDCGKGPADRAGGSTYFIYSGGEKVPLELLRPLTCSMSTLQHLCRKTVNGHLDMSTKRDQLPQTLQEFLEEYDAPI